MSEQSESPILVTIPNTTELKMQALCSVAKAIEQVAKALNSVNVQVSIENCHIEGSPAVSVELEE